jgi:hypothetical protein
MKIKTNTIESAFNILSILSFLAFILLVILTIIYSYFLYIKIFKPVNIPYYYILFQYIIFQSLNNLYINIIIYPLIIIISNFILGFYKQRWKYLKKNEEYQLLFPEHNKKDRGNEYNKELFDKEEIVIIEKMSSRGMNF